MSNRSTMALAAALSLASGIAFCAEGPLSLDEAQRLAIERSRSLTAQALGIGAARERALAAGQLPDPVLTLAIDNLPIEKEQAAEAPAHPSLAKAWASGNRFSTTRDFMTMRRIGVMQEWTRGDKRELRAERYQLEARLQYLQLEADTARIWAQINFLAGENIQ